MDIRKKLMVCSAACLLAAGTVSAQDSNVNGDNRLQADAGTRLYQNDRVVMSDTSVQRQEGRFSRFMHRIAPGDHNASTWFYGAQNDVERPGVAPTSGPMIKWNSLD